MKTIVLGGTGHIGTYLIPMLVKEGHEVISVTRSESQPYQASDEWDKVARVLLDREHDEKFEEKLLAMRPDIIVDLINFSLKDTQKMVRVFEKTNLSHYLFCSSIWAHGRAENLPFDPDDKHKKPLDKYGENKFKSELYLKEAYKKSGFPATIIMPGQISGPEWDIIGPLGNVSPKAFQDIAKGNKLYLPNFGMETLHHVHGEDVAQVFFKAITHKENALGESFHAVSGESITLFGYAKLAFTFFGKKENIEFLPWEEWCVQCGNEAEIEHTYYHIARSGYFDIAKERKLLDYCPKYSNIETIKIAMQGYIDRNVINTLC